jgi:hypothetical protein
MGSTQGVIRAVMRLGMRLGQRVVALVAIALLTFAAVGCAKPIQPTELLSEPTPQPNRLTGQLAEVSPPETLETLKQIIDAYTPQVRILSPRPGEVLDDTTVSVRLQVRGLPLFKDDTWQLGPHLHLFLDNEPYKAVYDLAEPIVFEGLAPGTHTLRVFASRPWHESFKNQGAFDQRTFHVYAQTPQNEVNAKAPLLTYSRPQGTYGAEPIMLDFYLTNAPLHMSAQAETTDDLHDWRIRCTVNDQSFVFDQWQPIWLKGFKPGRNWVQLELIDESGNPIANRFNNTVRSIDYQPGGTDTLSRLVRGELDLQAVAGIIDPTYVGAVAPAPDSEAQTLEGQESDPDLGTAEAPEPEPTEAETGMMPPESVSPTLPQSAPATTQPETTALKQTPPEPDSQPTPGLISPQDDPKPNPFLLPEKTVDPEATPSDDQPGKRESFFKNLTPEFEDLTPEDDGKADDLVPPADPAPEDTEPRSPSGQSGESPQSDDSDSPAPELPSSEPPRVTPLAPMAPEMRPFI